MRRLRVQWRLLGHWLFKEPWHLWVGLAFIVVVCGPAIFLSRLYDWSGVPFAVSAGFLDLMGLLLVAIGLNETREVFGRDGFWSSVRGWWRSRPSFLARSKAVSRSLTGTARLSLDMKARMIVGPNPNLSLRKRVAFLEYAYEKYEERLHDLNDEVSKHTKELRGEIEHANAAWTAEDQKLRELVEETAIGGIHLEIMGLIWLLSGTVMAMIGAVL